jgi:hypothetical protein
MPTGKDVKKVADLRTDLAAFSHRRARLMAEAGVEEAK